MGWILELAAKVHRKSPCFSTIGLFPEGFRQGIRAGENASLRSSGRGEPTIQDPFGAWRPIGLACLLKTLMAWTGRRRLARELTELPPQAPQLVSPRRLQRIRPASQKVASALYASSASASNPHSLASVPKGTAQSAGSEFIAVSLAALVSRPWPGDGLPFPHGRLARVPDLRSGLAEDGREKRRDHPEDPPRP